VKHNKTKIAIVHWIDACHSEKLEDVDEAVKTQPLKCTDVGILLKNDKENVLLTSTYDEEDRVKYTNLIPKRYITKMTILNVKEVLK
jgi:hypothetical protein